MNPIEQTAARIRRELLARERVTQREMVRVYGEAIRRTRREIVELQDAIRQAQKHPADLTALRHREQRLEALLTATRQRLAEYVQTVTPALTNLQRDHAGRAIDDTYTLTQQAMGPGPQAGIEFRPPRGDVTARLIGNAADGTPLGDLLREVAGAQVKAARTELEVGIALGHHPSVIARAFAKATGTTLQRSLLIARTEGLGVYRQTSLETFRANPVVQGWTWLATVDRRVCPACVAMSGSVHTLDESLDSHPGCRCAMVPRTLSWQEMGFAGVPDSRPSIPAGADVFARLPVADQRHILGPGKHAAYAAGRIGLADMVRHTHSPRWGDGRRTASLHEALAVA